MIDRNNNIGGVPGIVVKPRDVMPDGARTLPAPFYTDAEYFNRELDALFRTMWICAGRADEIARPGQFVLRDVAGASPSEIVRVIKPDLDTRGRRVFA